MKIAVGADERLSIVEYVINYLQEQGHEIVWYGPEPGKVHSWPIIAQNVAEDLTNHRAEDGILLCWTGTGMSIAANKIPRIRAALCGDAETAKGAKLWNNANILCLSLRKLSEAIAKEILQTWYNTQYIPNASDDKCLALIEKLDKNSVHT